MAATAKADLGISSRALIGCMAGVGTRAYNISLYIGTLRHSRRRTIYINKQLGAPRIRMSLNGVRGAIFSNFPGRAVLRAAPVCVRACVGICMRIIQNGRTNDKYTIIAILQRSLMQPKEELAFYSGIAGVYVRMYTARLMAVININNARSWSPAVLYE